MIEANRINVVLHCHSVHGALLDDTVHPTIDAARAEATSRFPGRIAGWISVPGGYGSMVDILAERRRQMIARGDERIDQTLTYFRPRRRLYSDDDNWVRGFAWHAVMQGGLLLALGCIILRGRPVGFILMRDASGPSILTPLLLIVMVSLAVSALLWNCPRVDGVLTAIAIFTMVLVLTLLVSYELLLAPGSAWVLAVASMVPFALLAVWRCSQFARRWIEE